MKWGDTVACAVAAISLMGWGPALSHEFWMVPDRFHPAGDSVSLAMQVGENFSGELVGVSTAFVTQLHRRAAGRASDLRAFIPAAPSGAMQVPLAGSGTQLFWADTQPSHVELDAGRFHAYLHDEGLDGIIDARTRAGTADQPGRERFRRHVKTLVNTAAEPGDAALHVTGQRLEIVPLSDPTAAPAGGDLVFEVLWEGKPLPRALVKFWHRRGGQLLLIRATTDAQGRLVATPPFAGTWMASVVHMIPATDSPQDDWDSHWGSLTFEMRAR
ncbi:DUF4198 domain-containing protein [Caenimonas aquaedulcis]|uniref:DUF4198 domain-containing protein n=1 Tax=Caenimonas aquaedulcis TaxID=2793270 RepID=A0A931H4W5_9BURK|nr:DUF4198 domain-containing protein [Caenimonas aquaedulcis]MBG9388649.1 DUF4198 domain-containing protein [Caenimonas aquaedulcis]